MSQPKIQCPNCGRKVRLVSRRGRHFLAEHTSGGKRGGWRSLCAGSDQEVFSQQSTAQTLEAPK